MLDQYGIAIPGTSITYTDPQVRDSGAEVPIGDWFTQNAPSPTTQTAPAGATTPTQALPGWDQTKWSDPNKSDPKYDVGRILAKYPPTTAGLQQAWPEIQALYPGATFDGKDSISGIPGTLGAVDVLQGASQGGTAWWWGDQGDPNISGQGAQAGQPGAMSPYGSYGPSGPGSGDYNSFNGTASRYGSPTWQGGDYQMPGMDAVINSPGYQTRLNAGLQAMERSAAAKGTVLNGGTQKALARYGQDYAANEYQNYDQNAFRNYQSRYGQFRDYAGDTRTDYALNTSTQRNAQNDYWQKLQDLYQTGAQGAYGSYRPGVTT